MRQYRPRRLARPQRQGWTAQAANLRQRRGHIQRQVQGLAGTLQSSRQVAVRASGPHHQGRFGRHRRVETQVHQAQVNVGAPVAFLQTVPTGGVPKSLLLPCLLCRAGTNRTAEIRSFPLHRVGAGYAVDRIHFHPAADDARPARPCTRTGPCVNGIGSVVCSKRLTTGVQPRRNVEALTICSNDLASGSRKTMTSIRLPNPALAAWPNPTRSANRNLAGKVKNSVNRP